MSEVLRVHTPDLAVVDVVFLHGLDGDAKRSWSAPDQQGFWPQWLADDVAGIAVWSVGYPAHSSRWRGHSMAIPDRATNLMALLQNHGVGDRPLCLVTHSMGGLLAKELLLHAAEQRTAFDSFARAIRGVVFLATPHTGSGLAKAAEALGKLYRRTPAVKDLLRNDAHLRQLNDRYRDWAVEADIEHLVFTEMRQTKGFRVVDETSANPGLAGVRPIPVDADHVDICKPANREAVVYGQVRRFVERLVAAVEGQSGAPRMAPQEVPLIVSVMDDSGQSNLIVDGDPPCKIAHSSRTAIEVTVEARGGQAVILERMRPVVLERRVPRLASSDVPAPGSTGFVSAMMIEIRYVDVDLTAEALGLAAADLEFTSDLNPDTPRMTAKTKGRWSEEVWERGLYVKRLAGGGFPYTVTASDPERFVMRPSVEKHEVAWELHLDWLCAGRRGTTVINNDGEPFRLYPERAAIAYRNGIDQLLARWSGWPSSNWVEDLWSRFHAHDGDARPESWVDDQWREAEEMKTPNHDYLMYSCHVAGNFLWRYKDYLEPAQEMKIKSDLDQARDTLVRSDSTEYQQMISVLDSDIFGSGLASQLYVAEWTADRASSEDRDQIERAIAILQQDFRQGKQETAVEQAEALMRRLFPWHSPR